VRGASGKEVFVGRFIAHILIFTIGTIVFLTLMAFGLVESWQRGWHPLLVAGVIAVVCIVLSYVWEAVRGKKTDAED